MIKPQCPFNASIRVKKGEDISIKKHSSSLRQRMTLDLTSPSTICCLLLCDIPPTLFSLEANQFSTDSKASSYKPVLNRK